MFTGIVFLSFIMAAFAFKAPRFGSRMSSSRPVAEGFFSQLLSTSFLSKSEQLKLFEAHCKEVERLASDNDVLRLELQKQNMTLNMELLKLNLTLHTELELLKLNMTKQEEMFKRNEKALMEECLQAIGACFSRGALDRSTSNIIPLMIESPP